MPQSKVDAFNQEQIGSFLRSGSRTSKASDRPLAHKLKEGTYQKHKKTGKQLFCFVFRMVHLRQQPALHCLLTSAQSAALDNMGSASRVFVQLQVHDVDKESRVACQIGAQQQLLNSACLRFWISLLDRRLIGDIFNSMIIGFLAVLEIDTAKTTFNRRLLTRTIACLDQDFSDARSIAGGGYSQKKKARLNLRHRCLKLCRTSS